MAWNFDKLDENLNKVAEKLPFILEGMSVVLANDVQVVHKQRITAGSPKKQYKSNAYKKLRESKGRQSSYIDMQLSGELFRSMKVGVEGGDVVYGVQNTSVGKTDTSTIYKGQIDRNNHEDILGVQKNDTTRGIEAAQRFFNDKMREVFAEIG